MGADPRQTTQGTSSAANALTSELPRYRHAFGPGRSECGIEVPMLPKSHVLNTLRDAHPHVARGTRHTSRGEPARQYREATQADPCVANHPASTRLPIRGGAPGRVGCHARCGASGDEPETFQFGNQELACLRVIDFHVQEAAGVVVGMEQRYLLAAVHRVVDVGDVEGDGARNGVEAGAGRVDESGCHARLLNV